MGRAAKASVAGGTPNADGFMSGDDYTLRAAMSVVDDDADDEYDVRVAVLVAEDDADEVVEAKVARSTNTTRWCVDSGANRDICRERHLFSAMRPRTLHIGEPAKGIHSPPPRKELYHYGFEAKLFPCSAALYMPSKWARTSCLYRKLWTVDSPWCSPRTPWSSSMFLDKTF